MHLEMKNSDNREEELDNENDSDSERFSKLKKKF
jgi:hypothetical protein